MPYRWIALLFAQAVFAAPAGQILPSQTRYAAEIPTFKQSLGFEIGDEISSPEQIAVYLKALSAAAPDRTRLIEYARSWEGRPLHLLIVGSPQRMARLDQVRGGLQRLADPRRTAPAEAGKLMRELPVVTWLMHAVHGNEISSSEAALALAYHLLAARQDATVDTILRESLVLIDPLQNPDGRARFLTHTLLGRAARPDPEPAAAEHDEAWPGGRSNHYLFDMNRDWFAQSQPETRGKTRIYLDWYPQVVVDLHEMGGDETYYFAPPAEPLNPHITSRQAALFDLFGRANARRFDERGFAYFIREAFDSFYPGYGESWPIFHGSVGMTYEQASTRGLVWRRQDESLLTYADAVLHHFTAGLTTAETAARNRERLLREFYEYRQEAVQEGERGPAREYLVPPGIDPPRSRRLARLIADQGIDVRVAQEPVKLASRELPAGTFVFPLAQPAARLLRNLMDPDTRQPEAFVKEQDRRRKKRLPDQIYDITAWSLPELFDVEVLASERPVTARTVPLAAPAAGSAPAALPAARVAYLIPWGSGAAAAVVEALQAGVRAHTAGRPFTLGGRRYAAGTAIVRTAENKPDLPSRLASIAARHGIEVVPTDTGYVEEGISLGSGEVAPLRAPRVLLLWDSPASSSSAGWARYNLERRFEQPVTAVRASSLGRIDLRRFDVLVLPSGSYGQTFGSDALRRLKDWISAGGTLVTLAEASRWAARENVGLLSTRTELADGRPETESAEKETKKSEPPPKPFDLEKAIQPEKDPPAATPGALLRVDLDLEHWLAAGTDGTIQAMVEGRRVFTPIKLDQGRNVGLYSRKDRLVAGGLAWEEAQQQLAQKAFLIHQELGRGHVIAFAEDPNYRAFAEATALLFINAVLLGPAH